MEIPAFVRCANCMDEVNARIIVISREDKIANSIEPPRSWLYVWDDKDTKENGSQFACCRVCSRELLAIVAKEGSKIAHSWSEQTQTKETYTL